jgi:hypothetical protein
MKNLDSIAKDLFNKIRGRFPNIILGDDEGNVTNIPSNARYFDFSFLDEKEKKVSVSLDQDNGIVVIVGKNIVGDQPEHIQDKWYNFLKELRVFSKKRLLNFDVRDINKSILNKRDYKFLAATRPGDETMAESKMYGTNKTSYQRIGNARLAIKHTHPINLESTGGRSQKIKAIYVESPEGERFKYPYNHVAGARAMARHVSEGGNAYDDFGKYISGLSNEASKLQKFKKYMNRSSVMAETLSGYMDTVNTRIQEVKKEIIHLQKEGFYKQAIENFTVPVVEDVPEGVSENWIDQLTIKQFNEELKDVFPYIYKLIGEATKVKDLGPEDLDEAELDTDETNEAGGIGGGLSGTKFSKAADYAPAVGAGVRGAVDNFTMGGGKYARAAADYGIKNLGALAGKNDPTTWDKEIGQEREKDIAAQTNYPVAWDIGDKAATVAQVATGVGAGKVLATKAARAAAASAAASAAAKAAAKKAAADSKYKAMGMSNAELTNAMKISKSPELARELQRRIALRKLPNLPVPKPLNLTPQMRTTPTSTLKLTPGMRTTSTREELEIEAAFESMMGQFADHVYKATTDTIDESGLQYYTGVKKHGKEYMKKAAQAGREGASQEELGRLKDKYSKAEKKTKEDIDIEDDDLDEAEKKGLYYYVNKQKKSGTSRPKNHPKAPSTQDWKNAAKTAKEELEIEAAFESMMGQFSDHMCEDCGNPSWRTLSEEKQKGVDGKVCWKGYKRMGTKMKGGKRVDNCVKVSEAAAAPSIDNIQTVMRVAVAQGKRWDSTIKIPGMKWPLDNQAYIRIGQMIQSGKDASSLIQQEIQKIQKLANFIKQNNRDPRNPVHKAVMSLLQEPSILRALEQMVRMLSQSGSASEATTDQFAERIAPAIKDRYRTDKNWTAADNNYNGFIIYVSKDKIANGMHVATAVSAATAREVEGVKTGANKAQKAVELIKQKLDARISSAKKVTADATLDFNVKFMQELSQDLFELGYDEGQAFYAKIDTGPVLVIANLGEFAGLEKLLRSDEKFALTGNRGKADGNVMPSLRITAKKMQATDLVANGRYIIGNPKTDSDGHYVYPLQFDSIVNDKGDLLKFNKPAVTVGANRNESVDEATPNRSSYSGMNDNELVAAYAMHKNQARVSKLSNKKGLEYTHQLAMSEIEAEQKRRGMKSESIVDEVAVSDKTTAGYITVRLGKKLAGDENKKPYLVAYAGHVTEPKELTYDKAIAKASPILNAGQLRTFISRVLNSEKGEPHAAGKPPGVILALQQGEGGTVGIKNSFPFISEVEDWIKSRNQKNIKIELFSKEETIDNKVVIKRPKNTDAGYDPQAVASAEKKRTTYFSIKNPRLMNHLRQTDAKFMREYYRPNIKEFVMGEKEFSQFLKKVNGGEYKATFGDPGIEIDIERSFIESANMKDDATVPNDSTSSPLSKTRKTPIGEFILSYFDRETGRFPKGETAVLTAVQKDYGDQYVKPAVEFIKKVEAMTAKKQVEKIQNSPHPETEMIKHLAGV